MRGELTSRAGAAAIVIAVLATTSRAAAHDEPCTSKGGEDTCPQGEACTAQDGTFGVCASPPCSTDAECVAPRVRCDHSRTPATCIECSHDAECNAGRTCELDPRSALPFLCVECSPGHDTCEGADAGHRCLYSKGTCGCERDGDCAAGRACGPRSTCEPVGPVDGGHAEEPAPREGGASDAGDAFVDIVVADSGCAMSPPRSPARSGTLRYGIVAIGGLAMLARRVRRRQPGLPSTRLLMSIGANTRT